MNFNISCPLNSVSFGFVGYNILKALYEKGLSPSIFPISQPDISSFDRATDDFKMWIESGIKKSISKYSRNNPEISIWHLNGSERAIGNKKYLISFVEVDAFTPAEINIIKNQEKVFFTSEFTVEVAKGYGLDNVFFLPLGFDTENFRPLNKHPYQENCIVSLISGKWEDRKQTQRTIQLWLNRFANNPQHRLHLSVYNTFFTPEQNQAILQNCFGGKQFWNVNVLPYTKTLTEYNQILNSCDLIIDMSKAESWSLPSFNSVCLGKHALLHNVNGIKSWANPDAAVLVEPNGKADMIDGVFFHANSQFNSGRVFTWADEDFNKGLDTVIERVKKNRLNEAGISIGKKLTWENTANILLDSIK